MEYYLFQLVFTRGRTGLGFCKGAYGRSMGTRVPKGDPKTCRKNLNWVRRAQQVGRESANVVQMQKGFCTEYFTHVCTDFAYEYAKIETKKHPKGCFNPDYQMSHNLISNDCII